MEVSKLALCGLLVMVAACASEADDESSKVDDSVKSLPAEGQVEPLDAANNAFCDVCRDDGSYYDCCVCGGGGMWYCLSWSAGSHLPWN